MKLNLIVHFRRDATLWWMVVVWLLVASGEWRVVAWLCCCMASCMGCLAVIFTCNGGRHARLLARN
eukprot:scaffold39294_cov34-Tisochrysis_lutea.AAC.4